MQKGIRYSTRKYGMEKIPTLLKGRICMCERERDREREGEYVCVNVS
jgi:hypothetical protein